MVEVYRRAIENPSDHRKLAKAIVDEMQNRGVGLSIEEARQVALAESSDLGLDKFYDESGHEVDPAAEACEECGSKRASLDPKFACASCGRGLDPREPQCRS